MRMARELDLIRFLQSHVPCAHPLLRTGIGHDGAVLKPGPGWIVSTDAQVENVHFRKSWLTWEGAGFRAAQVALSDLSGMACHARLVFLDLDVPAGWAERKLALWAAGFGAALTQWKAALAGGNLSASPAGLHAHLTVMGEAGPRGAVLRGGAQVGDLVVSPAVPGLARLGLELLRRRKRPVTRTEQAAIAAWRRPTPQRETPRLAKLLRPTAGMDLSDGLAADLPRLVGAGKGVILFPGAVLRREVMRGFRLLGMNPEAPILAGGEEYQPLWSVPPSLKGRVPAAGWRVLGEICEGEGLWLRENRRLRPVTPAPFDHFSKRPAG